MWSIDSLVLHPALMTLTFVVGSVVGSFLNVVAWRLPIMLERSWQREARSLLAETEDAANHGMIDADEAIYNLAWPGSHCPACMHSIRFIHNLPIIGYYLAGRKCSHCQAPISPRYPLVELATALLTLVVILKLGFTPAGLAALVLTWVLIAITLIDQARQLIPDNLTLPFLWLGLICNLFGLFTDIESALIGCMAGYLCLWLVYQSFKLLTGKEGMGYGDFKLLALLGAWLGWQLLPMILLLASLTGALVGGLMIAMGHDRRVPIAFGPWLAMAGWVTLLWGEMAKDYYLSLIW